jgi:hypothetical protein
VESEFGGSPESGGRFCVGTFGKNLASVAVNIFSYLNYIRNKCYTFCTLNAISKDTAAINCISI